MTYKEQVNQLIDSFYKWFEDETWLEKGRITDHLTPYHALFQPITINKTKIKNRIVMGPMGNVNMSDELGKPSDKMIAYYTERAKGGVGLIMSGMIPVSMDDPSYGDLDGTSIFPRIDSHRSSYSGWRNLIEGCHAFGSKFFIQLAPGMGRVGNPECLTKKMKLPVSSSWHKNWYIPQIPCRPLSDRAIDKLIKKTGQLAADCKALGADGVYLHGHSGYFIEQMTDTAYNKRKLSKFRHHESFGLALIKAIRQRVGPDYPISYRINLTIGLNETYKEEMSNPVLRRLKGERSVEMTLDYMKKLVAVGVDMFDVDIGGYENWWLPHPPNGMPPGLFVGLSKLVKTYFKSNDILTNTGQEVVVAAVGKMGNPDLSEKALRQASCDMVMLSRPLLADPDWANKVYADQIASIIPCIGDHEGCLAQLAIGGHPHCAVNPRTAFEHEFKDLPMTNEKKEILVIGAGPSGVNAAITLDQRGHKVTIVDKHPKAGGMLLKGGKPKIKYEINNYINYLNYALGKSSVEVIFNKMMDETMIKTDQYDIIITCTGTSALIPPIKGVNKDHVVSATRFLSEPEAHKHYGEFIVVGGSDVGCEVAHMLSYEYGKKVSIIELGPRLMARTCASNRHFLIHHLKKNHVNLMNCSKLMEIKSGSVIIETNRSKTVPDPGITWTPILPENIVNPFDKKLKEDSHTIELNADCVVLATGALSDDALYEKIKELKLAKQVINLGDSNEPGRVLEAVKSGYRVGRTL